METPKDTRPVSFCDRCRGLKRVTRRSLDVTKLAWLCDDCLAAVSTGSGA